MFVQKLIVVESDAVLSHRVVGVALDLGWKCRALWLDEDSVAYGSEVTARNMLHP